MTMRRLVLALHLLALLALGCERVTVPKTPTITLANKSISAEILLPDPVNGVYRGSRFDWSATVGKVVANGHTFFGPWRPEAASKLKPTSHDGTAIGLAEEFSHTDPPGYRDPSRETFVKIGVGVLKKIYPATSSATATTKAVSPRYFFARDYPVVDHGEWSTRRGKDWVETTQKLVDAAGVSYRYTKRVSLDAKTATIVEKHTLANDGNQALRVDHYCHNFLNVDAAAVGPDYSISVPFEAVFLKSEKVAGKLEAPDQRVLFKENVALGRSVEGELFVPPGATAGGEQFTLHHSPTRTAIRVSGDQPVVSFNLFCTAMAVCPEPYVIIEVPAGGRKTWVTKYEFLNE